MLRNSQAALFHGPDSPWEIRSADIPAPSDGQILVQVLACTICGSDLHTICGRRHAHTPAVLGHEIVGRIIQIGPNTHHCDSAGSPLQVNDRIVWTIVAHCGHCFFCQHDLPQKCLTGYKYGHQQIIETERWHGGFASHCTLLSGTQVVKIPDSIDDLQAAPISCATATTAAAIRIANPKHKESILVVGAGMLGLTACAWAKTISGGDLVCIEQDECRRELAKSFGACISAPPNSIAAESIAHKPVHGFDVVFECSGTNGGALEALRLVRMGGRIVLVGAVFPSEPAPIVLEQIVRRQLTIHGVHNYQTKDLIAAVAFMEKHNRTFPFSQLVTHQYPLQQIEQAIKCAQDPRNIRVAIRP